MSGTLRPRTPEEAVFIDPLDALRAADHRPLIERWRDRLAGSVSSISWTQLFRHSGMLLGASALVVAIGWKLFVTSQPPIEDSLPIVERTAQTTAPRAVSAATSAPEDFQTSTEAETVGGPQAVVVHVAGAVMLPGVVNGTDDWRVHEAIEAAGGALSTADLDRINLAAPIGDGQRIFVPEIGQPEPMVITPTESVGPAGDDSVPVDVNNADSAALQTLPGVGPATAEAIIAHRSEYGPFASVDTLVAVRGIGPATLERLRDHVAAN